MTKSEKLKAAIRETGLKYRKIAELTHIPEQTLTQYCNGRDIPDSKLELLCVKLGIDTKIFGIDVSNSLQKEAM